MNLSHHPLVKRWILAQARACLQERRDLYLQIQNEKGRFNESYSGFQICFPPKEALDRSPLGPQHTVHEAHRRHPQVVNVFRRYNLPSCMNCAVGKDETLQEAAYGELLPLQELLKELNTLLLRPRYMGDPGGQGALSS